MILKGCLLVILYPYIAVAVQSRMRRMSSVIYKMFFFVQTINHMMQLLVTLPRHSMSQNKIYEPD